MKKIGPFAIGALTILYLWFTPNLGYLAGNTYSPIAALAIPVIGFFLFLATLLGGLYSIWRLLKETKHTILLTTIPFVLSILFALSSIPLLIRVREHYNDAKLTGFGDKVLSRIDIGLIRTWMSQVSLNENRVAMFDTDSENVPESIKKIHPYSITVHEELFPSKGNKAVRFIDFKWPSIGEAWGLQISALNSEGPFLSKSDEVLRLRDGVYVYEQIK